MGDVKLVRQEITKKIPFGNGTFTSGSGRHVKRLGVTH